MEPQTTLRTAMESAEDDYLAACQAQTALRIRHRQEQAQVTLARARSLLRQYRLGRTIESIAYVAGLSETRVGQLLTIAERAEAEQRRPAESHAEASA